MARLPRVRNLLTTRLSPGVSRKFLVHKITPGDQAVHSFCLAHTRKTCRTQRRAYDCFFFFFCLLCSIIIAAVPESLRHWRSTGCQPSRRYRPGRWHPWPPIVCQRTRSSQTWFTVLLKARWKISLAMRCRCVAKMTTMGMTINDKMGGGRFRKYLRSVFFVS